MKGEEYIKSLEEENRRLKDKKMTDEKQDITRYKLDYRGDLCPHDNGDLVKYSDVKQLIESEATLRAKWEWVEAYYRGNYKPFRDMENCCMVVNIKKQIEEDADNLGINLQGGEDETY